MDRRHRQLPGQLREEHLEAAQSLPAPPAASTSPWPGVHTGRRRRPVTIAAVPPSSAGPAGAADRRLRRPAGPPSPPPAPLSPLARALAAAVGRAAATPAAARSTTNCRGRSAAAARSVQRHLASASLRRTGSAASCGQRAPGPTGVSSRSDSSEVVNGVAGGSSVWIAQATAASAGIVSGPIEIAALRRAQPVGQRDRERRAAGPTSETASRSGARSAAAGSAREHRSQLIDSGHPEVARVRIVAADRLTPRRVARAQPGARRLCACL